MKSLQFLEILIIEDHSSMAVSLEVNSNIVVFCLFMQVFHASSGKHWIHAKSSLEIMG
jgi:hypothetical protein